MSFSSIALAATDSTDIEINVTKDEFVNLIGSLAGNTVVPLTEAEVDNTSTVMGTLGTESNVTGGCDIGVSSANTFKLEHTTVGGLYLHSAAEYTVGWAGNTFSSTNLTGTFASCDNAASNVTINTPAITALPVQAGTYSDTLTVTVTTQ
ncbi:MAG: hypothetical protein ACWA41_01775 [Putridiphycobacter sp.]